MASTKEYLEFILGQLSEIEEITYRAMMGEFIIYYRGKIVGGIYDDRLLVKPVKAAISYMPTAPYELPYEGAKQMLLVDEVDNKNFLAGLFNACLLYTSELKERAAAIQAELSKAQEATVNAEKFMNVVRRHTSFEELTPTLLREFVEKIVVHECSYDENKTRRQDIEIYYSFVGKVDLPE